MGKIIHTKDGRTLMKGPDGRWMKYSGEKKAAEKNSSSKYQLQKVRPFDYKGARSEMAYVASTKEQAIDTIKNAPFVVTNRSFEKSKDTSPSRFKKITDYEMKVHPKDGEFGTKAYAYSATLNDKEGTVLHFADISNDAAKALGYKKTEGKTHTQSGYIFKTAEEAQEAARKAAAWDVENDRSAGRFKSAGKAAEKKPITNETREGWNAILNSKDGDKIRIQDFSSLNHKPTGTETEYTLHNGRWSSANGHSFDNDITNKGFGSFEGIVPKITKVESEAPKKPATQFERDQKLAEKGGKEYEAMMKRREEAVKSASDRAKTSNSFIRKAALQERDRLRKEYEDLAEYAGDEVKRKTPRDSEIAKSKSLSFEKREGYGLNPSEYKLSNGDGISPKSLNPQEGNPTNIKQLKDIPGRTSRHTDEIIVKSNYGDKEYIVTREHYKDTKTGYHKAEVVDIRQHVADKEKAPAKKESFKAKERTDYINNISRLRNNGDKKDEDWRVVRQTLDHAPTGTVMIEKGERGSERQYKKLADGSWEYITGSYKGEKTDSKTMSMGWAGQTGKSPSIEFTTEKKMAAAKTKAQKLPKFVENAKSPSTVVTKTGNKMLLDLGNSDFTAVNVRTLEKQGWKRRGTSDLTWYKDI